MRANKWKSYLLLSLVLYYGLGTMEHVVYDSPFTTIDLIQYFLSFAIAFFVVAWAVSGSR